MAAYEFPVADFSWLGNIPRVAEEAKQRQARQSLADMASEFDLNTTSGLTSAAKKAISQGLFDEGNRFLTAAQAKENEIGRRLTQQAYLGWLAKGGLAGAAATLPPGATPPTAQENTVDFGGGATPPPTGVTLPGMPAAPSVPVTGSIPTPAPPAPLELPAPDIPKPRTEIPPSLNAPPLRVGAESPTEQVLAAAEGGPQPVQAPPMQLAGPPPSPGPAPPMPAAQPPVPFMPQAPSQLQTVPGAISPQRLQMGVPGAAGPYAGARQEADQLRQRLMEMPFGSQSSPAAQTLKAQFTSALNRLNLPEQEISYHQELLRTQLDNKERAAKGIDPLPEPTRADFKTMQADAPKSVADTREHYLKTYAPGEETARTLGEKLVGMRKIMDDPGFSPGAPGTIAKGVAYAASWAQALKAQGIPVPVTDEQIRRATNSTALKEVFTSLSNQSVTAALGGLSKSISDADRNFLTAAYPGLSQTKQGMELIHDFLSKMATRLRLEAETASSYGEKAGIHATVYGMDQAVRRALQTENSNMLADKKGNLTELGQKMQDAIAPTPRIGPEHEGLTGTDATGKRFIIRNGRAVELP